MIHNEIIPAVNQIEMHPFHQQIETQQFMQENKVQIESWGPFAEGKNLIVIFLTMFQKFFCGCITS